MDAPGGWPPVQVTPAWHASVINREVVSMRLQMLNSSMWRNQCANLAASSTRHGEMLSQ
jgi:hypothetical protein